MSYLQRLVVNTLTFISLTVLFPNLIYVESITFAILASFILSILNMFVRPILTILSLPFTLLTFGLFTFVINGLILKMTSVIVGPYNFGFSSFGGTIIVAMILSLVNMVVTDHNMNKWKN